ncbi:MAG TPA: hypothetical protein VEA69_08380 [Tepidisphaeraceae bacterium]|nr:hypothetical protein [Tepidisphaeraceae bacterium]
MRQLLLALALLLTTLPATACLNDRQVLIAENEFKSSYLKKDNEPAPPSRSMVGWIALGAGSALLFATPLLLMKSKR